MQCGMDGFLSKPAHLAQLREALRTHTAPAVRTEHEAIAPPTPAITPRDEVQLDRATFDQVRSALSPEQYAALLAKFFDDRSIALAGLRHALATSAHSDVRTHAHALRGAALNLGLRTVAQTAEQLLTSGTDTPVSELTRLLDALDQHLTLTRAVRAARLAGGLVGRQEQISWTQRSQRIQPRISFALFAPLRSLRPSNFVAHHHRDSYRLKPPPAPIRAGCRSGRRRFPGSRGRAS